MKVSNPFSEPSRPSGHHLILSQWFHKLMVQRMWRCLSFYLFWIIHHSVSLEDPGIIQETEKCISTPGVPQYVAIPMLDLMKFCEIQDGSIWSSQEEEATGGHDPAKFGNYCLNLCGIMFNSLVWDLPELPHWYPLWAVFLRSSLSASSKGVGWILPELS